MLTIDPEIAEALLAMQPEDAVVPARGDYEGIRASSEVLGELLNASVGATTRPESIAMEFEARDGTVIALRVYKPKPEFQGGAALLYVHGGGKITGSLDDYDGVCGHYAANCGVTMISIDYRLAPEHPFPTPVNDCFDALQWVAQRAEEIGFDAARLGVMGDSGGGGIAAGLVLMARDLGGAGLNSQILVYPMLDDRNVEPDPDIAPFAVWTYDANYTGWSCFLGDAFGTDDVSPYASPSRNTDFSNLPNTYIEVGDVDIFRDECIAYAASLSKAAVPVELHVYPGMPHAGEFFAPQSAVAVRMMQARLSALSRL